MVPGHDQERRRAQGFDPRHRRLLQRDGAEDGRAAARKAHDRHAAGEIAERHPKVARDRQQAFVDLLQRRGPHDVPAFEHLRHGRLLSSEKTPLPTSSIRTACAAEDTAAGSVRNSSLAEHVARQG